MMPHRAQLGFFLKNSGSAPLICHDPGDPCREEVEIPCPPPRNRLTALLLAPRRLQSGGPAAAPSAVSFRPPAAPRPLPGRERTPWPVQCRLQMDSVGSRTPVVCCANAAYARRHLFSSSRASITRWSAREDEGGRGKRKEHEPSRIGGTTISATTATGSPELGGWCVGCARGRLGMHSLCGAPPMSLSLPISYLAIAHSRGREEEGSTDLRNGTGSTAVIDRRKGRQAGIGQRAH